MAAAPFLFCVVPWLLMRGIDVVQPSMVPGRKKRKKPRKPVPQRHRWFDQWLVTKGEPLRQLVVDAVAAVALAEERSKARQRARRPLDQAHHLARIETVVANLAYSVLNPPQTGRLAVNTRHGERGRTRYENPALGKPFGPLLDTMQQLKLLRLKRARVIRGEMQSLVPTTTFRRSVIERGVTLADFGRREAEEVILLHRNVREQGDWTKQSERKLTREPINYVDDKDTRSLRTAMRRLNVFLAEADISFIPDGKKPLVDPYDRTLRRHFVMLLDQKKPRFDQSGRLFGAFWMNMKADRRKGIRINGEPAATLDYGSMFTRLAYAEIGAVPPEGDLYAIPGFEDYRSGIKMAMNCLLFDKGPRRRWPTDIGVGVGTDRDAVCPRSVAALYAARLPEGATVRRTKAAILQRHPALKAAWGHQLGHKLMHMESKVLMAVLQELMWRGIPALSLHDGIMVAASNKETAIAVMSDVSADIVGLALPVTEKG